MRAKLIALVGALFSIHAAQAADLSEPVFKTRTAPWTWTGFYMGIHGGNAWGKDPFSLSIGFGNTVVALHGIDLKGAVLGGHVGFNKQFGSLVGGVELGSVLNKDSGAG